MKINVWFYVYPVCFRLLSISIVKKINKHMNYSPDCDKTFMSCYAHTRKSIRNILKYLLSGPVVLTYVIHLFPPKVDLL